MIMCSCGLDRHVEGVDSTILGLSLTHQNERQNISHSSPLSQIIQAQIARLANKSRNSREHADSPNEYIAEVVGAALLCFS